MKATFQDWLRVNSRVLHRVTAADPNSEKAIILLLLFRNCLLNKESPFCTGIRRMYIALKQFLMPSDVLTTATSYRFPCLLLQLYCSDTESMGGKAAMNSVCMLCYGAKDTFLNFNSWGYPFDLATILLVVLVGGLWNLIFILSFSTYESRLKFYPEPVCFFC